MPVTIAPGITVSTDTCDKCGKSAQTQTLESIMVFKTGKVLKGKAQELCFPCFREAVKNLKEKTSTAS
jgi:hypothetical protein